MATTTPPPDVLWVPDVNIFIHAAEKLRHTLAGLPSSPAHMLHTLDALGDDAMTDLVNATVSRTLVTCDLILGTAAHVLVKDLGWDRGHATQMLTAISFAGRRIPISRWSDVRAEALTTMYNQIAAHAPEHLAAVDSNGRAVHPGEPRVDGEDLGVFVTVQRAQADFNRPAIFATSDREAAQAAEKSHLSTVTGYVKNSTTGRLHATAGHPRITRDGRAADPSTAARRVIAPARRTPAMSAPTVGR